MGFVRNRRRVGGRTLAAALLGTTFLVGLAGPALADGHLEAENAELRSMIEDLQQELQILKNMVLEQNQKNMEQDESIAAAAEPSAPSTMVRSGKDNVSLTVYGQVNRMMLRADDGDEARTFQADNDISSTRVGFKGKAKMDDGWSAGTKIEFQIESNSSADVTIEDKGGGDDNKASLSERKLELWFKNKELGKLTLGQGSTASDGTIEEDLSGTGVITGAGFAGTGDSLEFMVAGAEERTSTEVSVGDLFGNNDGLSRKDRIRYDTPTFGGVQLSASWLGDQWDEDDETVDSGAWDVALRYGREFDGYEVAAAASRWEKNDEVKGQGGSASILAPFGTSLSGSYSVVEDDSEGNDYESTFTYFKLGQELDLLDVGRTSVSIGTADADDPDGKGTGGDYYDLAMVQRIKGLGTELYAVYGVYDASIRGVSTDEIQVLGAGARIKF